MSASQVSKYRPVFTGEQIILLKSILHSTLNSKLDVSKEEISLFKIVSRTAMNAELEIKPAYSASARVSQEDKLNSMLGLSKDELDQSNSSAGNSSNELLTESQKLMLMPEEDRNKILLAYQEELMKEFSTTAQSANKESE